MIASFLLFGLATLAHPGAVDLDARADEYADRLPGCRARFADYPARAASDTLQANTNFWLRGVDFTCASPWNASGGAQRAGTAVSRRHILFAKHFPIAVGARIAFVGDTGAVSHYSVKATKALERCDIMVGLLDYELTPDVHPAKVLPPDYARHLKDGTSWPLVTFNQREETLVSEISCKWNAQSQLMVLVNRLAKGYSLRQYGGTVIIGDSGSPAFLMYGGRPVLVYCLHTGGLGNGPFIHLWRREVQRTMDELCPGYRLEDFDFGDAAH